MQALVGIIGTIGAQAILRPRTDTRDQPMMDVVVVPIELEAADLAVRFLVE